MLDGRFFSFSLSGNRHFDIKKFEFDDESQQPTTCEIVPNNASKDSAILSVKRGHRPDWDKKCIMFQTKSSPQILLVTLDTDETHPVPGRPDKPLFHFHKIVPKDPADDKLITQAVCHISGSSQPVVRSKPSGQPLPAHTHTIEIHFNFPTDEVTLPRSFDFWLKKISDDSEHPGDPQVGNEPPTDPVGGPGGVG